MAENESSIKILAGAGSGKTTTMAAFVHNCIKNKIYKDTEICFITFTRFAGEEIKLKLRKISGITPNVMTGTIHSAMFKMLHSANIERPQNTKNPYDIIMEESVKFFLKCLTDENPKLIYILSKFRLLVVDEFQDLDDSQFEFIKLFKNILPTLRIVAIGDLAQNIYRFRGTSNEFLRTRLQSEVDPSIKTYTLTTNFRSTRKILDTVNGVFQNEIKAGHILPMMPASNTEEGVKPHYYEYAINPTPGVGEYEQFVAETILPIIHRGKKEGKSIVLLFPAVNSTSFNYITSLLRDYSKRQGYTLDLHKISKDDTTTTTVAFNYNTKDKESPVQFSTFHAAKGLEWDIVFVVNVSDSMYDVRDYEEDTEGFIAEKTNLFYVGITRAAKELYMFANANNSGRHRLLAGLGTDITKIMEVTQWGEEDHSPKGESTLRPISVLDLVRRIPQYPEIFERIKATSQNIKTTQKSGKAMLYGYVYDEMKKRNRELAFGTFIDWKIKQLLCRSTMKSFQDTLLGTMDFFTGIGRFLNKREAFEPYDIRVAKLRIDFNESSINPDTPIEQYVHSSRFIALHNGKYHSLIKAVQDLVKEIEYKIRLASSKKKPTIKQQYIIAQSRDFFTKGNMGEIQCTYAPSNKYLGLPKGFETFVEANNVTDIITDALQSFNIKSDNLSGDVVVEYTNTRIIIGEMDLFTEDNEGAIIEMKCSNMTSPQELRDTGNCKNLLQLLAYVAMGRHGTIKRKARWAFLLNPLTATYECYDLDTWSFDHSKEYMNCLNDLSSLVN